MANDMASSCNIRSPSKANRSFRVTPVELRQESTLKTDTEHRAMRKSIDDRNRDENDTSFGRYATCVGNFDPHQADTLVQVRPQNTFHQTQSRTRPYTSHQANETIYRTIHTTFTNNHHYPFRRTSHIIRARAEKQSPTIPPLLIDLIPHHYPPTY